MNIVLFDGIHNPANKRLGKLLINLQYIQAHTSIAMCTVTLMEFYCVLDRGGAIPEVLINISVVTTSGTYCNTYLIQQYCIRYYLPDVSNSWPSIFRSNVAVRAHNWL